MIARTAAIFLLLSMAAIAPAHAEFRGPTDLLKDCKQDFAVPLDASDAARRINACFRDNGFRAVLEARTDGKAIAIVILGRAQCHAYWLPNSLKLTLDNRQGRLFGNPTVYIDQRTPPDPGLMCTMSAPGVN